MGDMATAKVVGEENGNESSLTKQYATPAHPTQTQQGPVSDQPHRYGKK